MILTVGGLSTALGGVLVLTFGIVIGRPDVVAYSLPVLLTAAWALLRRDRVEQQARIRSRTGRTEAGEVRGVVEVDSAAESVLARVSAHGYRPRMVLLAGGARRQVPVSVLLARTGVHRVFRLDSLAESAGGLLVSAPLQTGPITIAVHPVPRPLRTLPLPHRLTGLTGNHTSRRTGDGYEMRDVHEFGPGDRLKRIDWRVSARRALDTRTGRLGTLYARRTFATADATVMIVVDSRDDVGPDVSTWAGGSEIRKDAATSLDLAREAAASIARHHLDGGDRVGLDDLGRRRRPVRPAAGRHQWQRISQRLLRVAPEGWPRARERPPVLPTGALVVVCSTFLDDDAARMSRLWRAHGHEVIAIDTLPPLDLTQLELGHDIAYRLVMLQRRRRLRELRGAGVAVVPWDAGAGTALHALARTHRQRVRR